MKKSTYYAIICPICGWKVIGNWKEAQKVEYYVHYQKMHMHMPEPIIKKDKR